jgi:hypothetical protein
MKSTITGSSKLELAKLPLKSEIQEPCYAWLIHWGHHGNSRYTEYALTDTKGDLLRKIVQCTFVTKTFCLFLHPASVLADFWEYMAKVLEHVRILADAMNYLDHSYCGESIVDWVRSSPEGRAYSIVRRLFIEVVEESNGATHLVRAA